MPGPTVPQAWTRIVAGCLGLCLLVPVVPSAADPEGCSQSQVRLDDPNDVRIYPNGPPVDEPAMDILGVNLSWSGTRLVFHVALGANPSSETQGSFRYWFGFEFAPPGADWQDWQSADFRIGSTTTYDEATLVGPNDAGNPDWGVFPVVWSGSNLSIEFDRADIRSIEGELNIGRPSASTDGKFVTTQTQGAPTALPYATDRADPPDDESLMSKRACGADASSDPANFVPLGGALPLLAAAVVALAAPFRRARSR